MSRENGGGWKYPPPQIAVWVLQTTCAILGVVYWVTLPAFWADLAAIWAEHNSLGLLMAIWLLATFVAKHFGGR